MAGLSTAGHFERRRLAGLADCLSIATAVSPPWSTSATGILLVLLLLALIPTLDWPDVRREPKAPNCKMRLRRRANRSNSGGNQFTSSRALRYSDTGPVTGLFKRAAEGQAGVRRTVSTNPHNQTFAVGIQFGLLGIAVLWAMWISQILLFRGTGLVAWIGPVVVTQNIVGSLFNSFIFDFTEGWLYVLGIDIAGGIALKKRAAEASAAAAP